MNLNLDDSTVTIADRRFPAVGLVCPPIDGETTGDDDRLLGGRGGRGTERLPYVNFVHIPAENGLLIGIEQIINANPDLNGRYDLTLYCRTCATAPWDDTEIYVPLNVALDGRTLTPEHRDWSRSRGHRSRFAGNVWFPDAEPEWVVEFIDRVSRLPFDPPDGPQARPIPLADAYQMTSQLS